MCFVNLVIIWALLELCKFFKNEVHGVQVTFGVYTESGYTWVIVLAAFFLMGGYFIIQVVIFRPWGLQTKYKKCFPKKNAMRPGLSKILFQSAPDLIHQELLTYKGQPVNAQGGDQPCPQPSTVLGCTTLHTAHSQPRAQLPDTRY